ncbi:MAG: Gfo/Idh/MocA family oxidoreductase [Planctomycetaceae bacterium]|nr:Gfo/Idh/MocA family oxidoreductase [Planctomycetaceae bacterium]
MSNVNTTENQSCRAAWCSRRSFLAGAGAAAAGFTILRPELVAGYQANEKVDIGVIGCGGRGSWIAALFQKHGGYNIVAAADYFQDRLDDFGAKLDVKPEARYAGLAGYHRMLEQKLDAIVVESPPYFHPEQAAAGVAAGKHVYLAKPIAVDVPGCQSVEESGKQATSKGLCFLVDFQTRSDPFYMEALRRVHEGAIGKFAFGEATYHADVPWMGQIDFAKEAKTNPESRLRAWGLDQVLSGDIITEQNIHTLDVASWIMGQPPVCAFGTGGRKVRDFGDCWDTFSVTFQYPDNVGIAFSSRQFAGHGTQPEGILNRMFGTEGVLETSYGGQVLIRGNNFYRGGSSPAIYEEGAVANIATFHRSILAQECANTTVPESVRSNLVTILGRTSAYLGEVVYWDQLLASNEKLEIDLQGLKS